ncbi:response regulator [Rickettsiella endosymbiont of Dermanyssus gallinae]|uniref:response regulator n=1 Tax=Rickettsiella endosymbiont of Dermanyssus gallinae TaxID=2856608 RepID=UPI001C52E46D|nr:response regulator [Rickettsiella endosymbiont of Dermanyssus gallinae]
MQLYKQQEKEKHHFLPALLVEDDVVCQMAIHSQLTHLGYQVYVVKTAEEAINLVSNKLYALILINLGLPDQPGQAVIQAARDCNLNKSTLLIACSTHIDKKKEETCLALGADKVLTKPILTKLLIEAIERSLLKEGS